jgi:hypothetical protein
MDDLPVHAPVVDYGVEYRICVGVPGSGWLAQHCDVVTLAPFIELRTVPQRQAKTPLMKQGVLVKACRGVESATAR